MSSSTIYSLHYFNGRGRAEATRLIFAQAGQKFEDLRHTQDEWAKLKGQMPLGQIPVLEFDGEKLPQSLAIARYAARKTKLAGKDDLESAKCDVIVDTMQEVNEAYYHAWFHIKDAQQKETEQTKFKSDTLPQKLTGLETLMNKFGNGTWAVGDNVTWADLLVFDSIQNVLKIDDQALEKHATLKKNHEAVKKLPNIAAYLANRKETAF
ncbi:unnamed protein product [Adineta steineri]|uniref:Glutathione S-transferase n=1 Tax=Adineta steineri TaxID=433720 RepID=A0A813VAP5_9BILA|nr:unnamed protein product [Adineta steineri]CAF1530542.1 unnamed protein product [Adineta steineri]